MTNPIFLVCVRHADGKKNVYKIDTPEIPTHEQAMALTRQELPNARAILCTVESTNDVSDA
jgi:hypothetical protein